MTFDANDAGTGIDGIRREILTWDHDQGRALVDAEPARDQPGLDGGVWRVLPTEGGVLVSTIGT